MGSLYDATTLHEPALTCTHTQPKNYLTTGYADPAQVFCNANVSVESKLTLAGLEPAILGSEDQRLIH